jgi:hypothetical protein
MKTSMREILKMCMKIMCKTTGETADLLRKREKRPCAKPCGYPAGKWRETGGGLADFSLPDPSGTIP